MIPNETKRYKVYDRLRKLISGRIGRAFDLTDEDLAKLSLAALINMLFLMHGDGGSTGNFTVTFSATADLIGSDLIWLEPDTKAESAQLVQ